MVAVLRNACFVIILAMLYLFNAFGKGVENINIWCECKKKKGEFGMAAIIDSEKCTGCGACTDVCPLDAIELSDDGVAVVDGDTCGDCGACVDECPCEAISMPE